MTRTLAQRGRFAGIVLQVMGKMGLGQTQFGHLIDVPDRTLRNWLNENRSPAVDWLLVNAHKLPAELVGAILQELAGPRFVIELMPDADATCIQKRSHRATVGMAELAAAIHAAKDDGRITPDEANGLLRRVWAVGAELRAICVELTLLVGAAVKASLTRRCA